MKTKKINHIREYMLIGMVLFLFSISSVGCYDTPEFDESLALNNDSIILPETEGITRIRVFADEKWNARFSDESPEASSWLTMDSHSGNGKGEFMLNYQTNIVMNGEIQDLNPVRVAKIIVNSDGKERVLTILQKGRIPRIFIPDEESYALARAAKNRITIESNVDFKQITTAVKFEEGETEKWMTDLAYDGKALSMNLSENKSNVQRSVKISLDYTDRIGKNTTDTVTVIQLPPSGEITDVPVSFDKVREYAASKPAGTEIALRKKEYIRGIVVSDKNNRNLAPPDVVGNTVYLQSEDGKQAFRLKIQEAKYNNYNLGDVVHVSLYKTKVIRGENPDCITLTNIKIENLLFKEDAPVAVAPHEKAISELTDRDMFTYVKLKSVEIAVPFGNFSNQNNGYFETYLKQNTYPIGIRDVDGNFMYMLSNAGKVYNGASDNKTGVLYQRAALPKGSGTISGILVHEDLCHYGGDQGRYSIRQLSREDVALKAERENGFSTVLAEWSKFAAPETGNKALTSETGIGTLSHSKCVFKDGGEAGTIRATDDYDGTDYKGFVESGAFACDTWWVDGKGAYWLVEVPTTNVKNPLS
ncbi:MAG: DUF5689 domain-containing protein, partial [Bacteroidaceae bacterium]